MKQTENNLNSQSLESLEKLTDHEKFIESHEEEEDALKKEAIEMELLNKEVLKASELLAYKSKSVPYLWEGLIPKYGISFLTGASDCNKSTFLRQLALSIANGDDEFLGIPLNTHHRKVIMVITEDLAVNVAALLNRQMEMFSDHALLDNIRFVFPQSNVVAKVKELLKQENVDCVIIDTWTDIFTGDLNASNSVRASLHPFNDMVRKYGCSVLALHHEKKGSEEKKSSKDNMLGSMGIQAYARVVLQMKRENGNSNKRLLTAVKGNYVSDSFKDISLVLELDEKTMTLSSNSEIISSNGVKGSARHYSDEQKQLYERNIIQYKEEGLTQDAIVEKLKLDFPTWKKTPSKGEVNKVIYQYGQSKSI